MNVIEKRTSEAIWYSIDCSADLDPAETITGITGITADETGLTFTGQAVNVAQVTFSDGRVAAIGKVIQVMISGGTIPAGMTALVYTIRAKYSTSEGNTREATVLLNVTDVAS